MTDTRQIVISKTGYAQGFGSCQWRQVSGLTREESKHVREGTARVIITGCPPSGGGNGTGTTLREVRQGHTKYQYDHHVPYDWDTNPMLIAEESTQ